MRIEKLSENWLFECHSKATIKGWLRHLRYFYFKRAWGGHANERDEFQVAFTYSNRQDLIFKLGQLNLTLNIIPDDYPRPVVGQSYLYTQFEEFRSEIKPYPGLEQPGQSIMFGYKAFVWVYENSIKISVSDTRDNGNQDVTEDDFEVCLELEKHFDQLGWQRLVDTSLEDNVCCISKKKYPELYSDETIEPNSKK